ncbi:MAG TPA: TIM barrel protein [Sphingobium sp.]|uniref:sugar phosphate isomerase/epimerase family protein n=1 Tax=Sphingobium sp. TaxID=1912891 RepID=UPI002ED4FD27
MTRKLGIDSQTIFGLPPLDHIALATRLGCSHVSFGLQPVPWKLDAFPQWSLRDDRALYRQVRDALTDQDMTLALAEGFTIKANANVRDREEDMDLFVGLGAQRVTTVCMDHDLPRALDELAVLTEMAAERSMEVVLEFAPPHSVNSLQSALAAVKQVSKANLKIVIDAMHFFRTGSKVEDLAAVEPGLLAYAQLCDAPLQPMTDDYLQEASFERKAPGDGELPLRDLLKALPSDIPLGLEVPMQSKLKAGRTMDDVVGYVVQQSRTLLDGL